MKHYPDSESESHTRINLEDQRDHILSEAKSGILKQESRADRADCAIRELQRQIDSSRQEIDHILDMKSLEESRPDFTKKWRNEKEHYEKLMLKEFNKWKNCKVRNCELTNL